MVRKWFARIDVAIPGRIDFWEWLPESQEQALRVELPDDGMILHVWVPAEHPFIYPPPLRGQNVICEQLRVLVTVDSLSEELCSQFDSYDPSPIPKGVMEDFLDSLYENVLGTVNRICLFVRDEIGRFTIGSLASHKPEGFSADLHAAWSWDGKSWERLRGPGPLRVTIALCADGSDMIHRSDWKHLQQFLNADRDTEFTRHLTANVRDLLRRGEYRAAVLDAAIALEREVSLAVEAFLTNRNLPTRGITGRDSSLRLLVKVWLPLIDEDLDAEWLEGAARVVELRNEVLHDARKSVREQEEEYIRKAVRLAEQLCNRRVGCVRGDDD